MVKILVVRPRPGSLRALFSKLTSINAKNGPFDLVLCCSDLFSRGGAGGAKADGGGGGDGDGGRDADADAEGEREREREVEAEVEDLLGGRIGVPATTYCSSGSGRVPEAVKQRADANAGEVCPNLILMEPSSVVTLSTMGGLRLGYFGGAFDPAKYAPDAQEPGYLTPGALASFQALCATGPLDVLVSHSLPQLVTLHSSRPPKDPTAPAWGCAPVTEAVKAARPRYHFAAGAGEFWEREPWVWDETGRTTRFLNLGEFQNRAKERWFYAFNIDPLPPGALPAPPPNATPSPYAAAAAAVVVPRGRKRPAEDDFDDSAPDFRFGTAAMDYGRKKGKAGPPPAYYTCKICQTPGHWIEDCPQRGDQKCHTCGQAGHRARECPMAERGGPRGRGRYDGPPREIAPDTCWFCLSNPRVTKHLITAIGSETYVTLPKGQLPDTARGCPVPGGGHVLIIPVAHYPSLTALPPDLAVSVLSELETFKSALRAYYASHGAALVSFEVTKTTGPSGRPGHAHVQICPVPAALGDKVEAAFREEGARQGVDFGEMQGQGQGQGQGLQDGTDYFRVGLPDGRTLLHVMDPHRRFNLQFGRLVLANLLGCPERADWKQAAQAEEDEKKDCAAFKKAFAPFAPSF